MFVVELHTSSPGIGPGIAFSALIPDFHYFKGSQGGRTLPALHPDGSPNLARGLVGALGTKLEAEVTAEDLIAYVAAVVAHPAFTERFTDELTTPGIRVPITADADLFHDIVELGREVVWLHTYGDAFTGETRPKGNVRYPRGDERQPLALTPITTMPTDVTYDAARQVVQLGDGEFGPVRPEVWNFTVGGKRVIKSWTNYRKADPGGKKTSPLDDMHVQVWDPDWTTEFIELLTVLTRLIEHEPTQADLLTRVMNGRLLAMDDLADAGVKWPTTTADRRPSYATQMSLDI